MDAGLEIRFVQSLSIWLCVFSLYVQSIKRFQQKSQTRTPFTHKGIQPFYRWQRNTHYQYLDTKTSIPQDFHTLVNVFFFLDLPDYFRFLKAVSHRCMQWDGYHLSVPPFCRLKSTSKSLHGSPITSSWHEKKFCWVENLENISRFKKKEYAFACVESEWIPSSRIDKGGVVSKGTQRKIPKRQHHESKDIEQLQ